MEELSIRAEQALLGAVLLDPGQQRVLEFVAPEDMFRPWHGQVLAAMRRVRASGGLLGPAEVQAELRKDPDLPASVSREGTLLAGLMDAAPRSGHAQAYAGMVVEGGLRRGMGLAGARLVQVAECGDVDAVSCQAAGAGRDLDAWRARWLALPKRFRSHAASVRPGQAGGRDAAGRAAAVRSELQRLRAQAGAGRAVTGEQVAAIARQVADAAAAAAVAWDPPAPEGRARGEAAQAAGLRALRDLAAGPSQIDAVRAWLRPGHFVSAGHGAVYAAMAEMRAAGVPVDPVTVAWESARRGIRMDAGLLAGGTGAFAAASAREVARLGVCAQAAQAGRGIQADAADLSRRPHELLPAARERLRGLEAAPQPQAGADGDARVVALEAGRRARRRPGRPGREAAP